MIQFSNNARNAAEAPGYTVKQFNALLDAMIPKADQVDSLLDPAARQRLRDLVQAGIDVGMPAGEALDWAMHHLSLGRDVSDPAVQGELKIMRGADTSAQAKVGWNAQALSVEQEVQKRMRSEVLARASGVRPGASAEQIAEVRKHMRGGQA